MWIVPSVSQGYLTCMLGKPRVTPLGLKGPSPASAGVNLLLGAWRVSIRECRRGQEFLRLPRTQTLAPTRFPTLKRPCAILHYGKVLIRYHAFENCLCLLRSSKNYVTPVCTNQQISKIKEFSWRMWEIVYRTVLYQIGSFFFSFLKFSSNRC